MARPPQVNSAGERELDRAEKQFKAFDESVQSLTLDRMNEAPIKEVEQQTKIASKDRLETDGIHLRPHRSIGSKEPFNENYRKQYEFDMEQVCFIAENNEIIGEDIDMWTKPYAGMPAQWWKVPVNKIVYGPRHLAEQIKRCRYHRLRMEESVNTGQDGHGTYYGTMVADTTIPRLDARPASSSKSIFMGR